MRSLLAAGVAAMLALGLVGCAAQARNVGGQPRTAPPPTRLVSLSPSTTEIMMTNNAAQMLLGRTESCDFPDAAKAKPIVMSGVKPDFERIQALNTQVAFYDKALFSEADLAKFKELNITLIGLDSRSLAGWEAFQRELVKNLGMESSISEKVDAVYAKLDQSRGQLEGTNIKVAVLIGTRDYLMVPQNGLIADMSKRIGLNLVAAPGDAWVPANLEQLISEQPNVIISTPEGAEAILKDARLQSLQAVKLKHVYGIREGVLVRTGARVDQLIESLATLAKRTVETK